MLRLLKRYRDLLIVAFLLVFPLVSFLSRGSRPREPGVTDKVVLFLSTPLERALTFTVDGAVSLVRGYVALRGVRERNELLEAEVRKLAQLSTTVVELQAENERLRRLLAYADEFVGHEVVARVVGVNPVNAPLSVRLNRGEDHEVRAGMPVVTAGGVVGRVMRATGTGADVLLLTDASSRIGVRVQRSRARATAVGSGRVGMNFRLENALRTEDLVDGDVVVTSGTDGIFPPGLLVGTLTNVQKGKSMFQSAEIVPAVDVTRLEEVLVLPDALWAHRLSALPASFLSAGAPDAGVVP